MLICARTSYKSQKVVTYIIVFSEKGLNIHICIPQNNNIYMLVERAEKYLDDVPTANSICIQHFHLCIESNKPIYIAVSKDKTPWN